MTELNGNIYYVDILTSNTFALYSDLALTTPINSTAYNPFITTGATATATVANLITVTDTTLFSLLQPVVFVGSLGSSNLVANTTYYVSTIPDSTHLSVSDTSGGVEVALVNETISATMYVPGGRVIAAIGSGTGSGAAAGSTNSIQYNNGGLLAGGSDLTFNFSSTPRLLSVNGDANVANLGSNGVIRSTRFLSNIATGTTPLEVVSTTRVANLNVSYANVSDFAVVTNTITSANFYPTFVSASATGNRNIGTNGNFVVNPSTGDFFASNTVTGTYLTGTLTTAAQPNITSVGSLTSVTSAGNIQGANIIANSYVIHSIGTGISAAGATQGTATALTKEMNVVSTVSVGQGVALPTAVAGMAIYIVNISANAVQVYPASGGTIGSLALNAAYEQASGATLHYIATSSTQWYIINAPYG
jgi:hypothetical protein